MIASVRHITKNHIEITPHYGFSLAVFNMHENGVEVVVVAHDGSEAVRLWFDEPKPDQRIVIIGHDNGIYDIHYHETVRR